MTIKAQNEGNVTIENIENVCQFGNGILVMNECGGNILGIYNDGEQKNKIYDEIKDAYRNGKETYQMPADKTQDR